jgi:hypothetical protein
VNANPPRWIVWTLRSGLACSSNRHRPALSERNSAERSAQQDRQTYGWLLKQPS